MVNLQWTDFMNANWLTFQKDKKPAVDILNRYHDYDYENDK